MTARELFDTDTSVQGAQISPILEKSVHLAQMYLCQIAPV
jgi:hypothetical protein